MEKHFSEALRKALTHAIKNAAAEGKLQQVYLGLKGEQK